MRRPGFLHDRGELLHHENGVDHVSGFAVHRLENRASRELRTNRPSSYETSIVIFYFFYFFDRIYNFQICLTGAFARQCTGQSDGTRGSGPSWIHGEAFLRLA
jgi:hypothetical protein